MLHLESQPLSLDARRGSRGTLRLLRRILTRCRLSWSTYLLSHLTTLAGCITYSNNLSTPCTSPSPTGSFPILTNVNDRYTASYDNASPLDKQAIFAKANNAILAFRRQIDKRLYISRSMTPHKTQVVFWISYYSVIINLQRPLLNPSDPGMVHNIPAAFRSATTSALAVTRLLKGLQASDEVKYLPPFVIYHVFRTALVHGLNIIAVEEMGGQRISTGNFWACFRVLGELSGIWKELCEGAMPFVLMATRGWGFQEEIGSMQEEANAEDDEDFEFGMDMNDVFTGSLIQM